MRLGLALALTLATVACSSAGDRSIVGPRSVPASGGAPDVERVVDLGDLSQLPAKGNLSTAASDGRFVVGELILVEGDDFGRLPTISIGGRPAKALARTKAGGIVSRIPTEVPSGRIAVEVSHPDGRGAKTIEVQRFLATASSKSVHLALAHEDGRLSLAQSIDVAGTEDLCFGHDGRVLYLAQPGEKRIKAVSLAARGGPALAQSYSINGESFVELACRADVPTVAVLSRNEVTFFDSRVPSALSVSGTVALPVDSVAATLSPDGQSLAVLGSQENSLSLVSLSTQKVVATLSLMDNETVPLLRDLVFSPGGNEIWVLSGNDAGAVVAGARPTRVQRVAVHGISLSRVGDAVIGLAAVPQFLAVSQREAVMAASTIRSTASPATLLLTALSRVLPSETGSGGEQHRSSLLRFDLEGKASALVEGAYLISRALVSHNQRWAYAVAQSPKGLVLLHTSISGGTPKFLELDVPAANDRTKAIPLGIAP
ncbi:MAG: hypothetical protein GY811_05415 [Myxococcales bacterium]|nr:hypothetical protein [Myxococcales bacterium]